MDTISYSLAAKAYKEALSKATLEGSAVLVPDGSTADRPVLTANDRAIRYNTDTAGLEEWDGTTWKNISADITAVRLKGAVTEASILAMVGMVAEDLWIASDTLNGWVYDGTQWVNIGPLQGPKGDQGIAGATWLTDIVDPVSEGVDDDLYLNTTSYDYFKKVSGVWQLVGNLKGITGDTGNGITSVVKTSTVGNVDTYTITFTDTTTTYFTVTNGINGTSITGVTSSKVGKDNTVSISGDFVGSPYEFVVRDGESIDHISRTAGTGAPGTTDTYTVWQDVGETVNLGSFSVHNGQDGLGLLNSIVAGDNVTVDNTDPSNPIINAEAGSEFYNQEDEPIAKNLGAVWYKPSEGLAYLYVNDGTSNMWAELSGAGSTASPINTPTITTPLNSVTDFASNIETSAYSTVATFVGPHTGTKLELATDIGFTNVVYTNMYGAVTSLSWPEENFDNQVLYARVQYVSDYTASEWSDVVSFTTTDKYVATPTLTVQGSPTSVPRNPTLTTSAFNVTNGTDTHVSTDWVVKNASNVVVWQSLSDTVNLVSITLPANTLDINTPYTFEARHTGLSYGSSQFVSESHTTANVYIGTPTLTVGGYPSDVGQVANFTGTSFTVYNGTDTHTSTTLEVYTDPGMTTLLDSITVTAGSLTTVSIGGHTVSTTYYARMKYTGATYESSWSTTLTYTTKNTFSLAYGVDWNPTTDTYTRTGLASGTPNSTSYAGSIQTQMKRCVLNANGTVAYYLHPTNSTLKENGTAATIDGNAGNVMVEIPKFYHKYENVGGVHKYSVSPIAEAGYTLHPAFIRGGVEKNFRYYPAYEGHSLGGKLISGSGRVPTVNQTRAKFRGYAAANGTGWSLIDWNLLYAVQLLFLTEYATFDTQAMLGNGNDTGSDYTMTTGGSNGIGNGSSPATNDNTWMSYRGIENWYASMWKFIDGVNVQERVYFVNNNPATFADDVFTGDYVSTGITSATSNGYVSNMSSSNKGFIPSEVAGSDSTKVPDYFYQTTGNMIVFFGGSAGAGLEAGGFCLMAYYAASGAYVNVGSGVSY